MEVKLFVGFGKKEEIEKNQEKLPACPRYSLVKETSEQQIEKIAKIHLSFLSASASSGPTKVGLGGPKVRK
tara:strand:+ start:602 stop:814 length:213 start_codon:yes stop_codon:yes gene_type:complete